MARAAKKNTDFASTLAELEQIVTRLETGDLPLEEALTAFERGIVLAREGQQRLAQAEQRVQILLSDNPNAELTPYPTDSQS